MPEGPKINVETLAEDGFGAKSFFECFVASDNETLVGFVLFFYTYSTWEGRSVYMEDLYVTPTHRNKGTVFKNNLEKLQKRTRFRAHTL